MYCVLLLLLLCSALPVCCYSIKRKAKGQKAFQMQVGERAQLVCRAGGVKQKRWWWGGVGVGGGLAARVRALWRRNKAESKSVHF